MTDRFALLKGRFAQQRLCYVSHHKFKTCGNHHLNSDPHILYLNSPYDKKHKKSQVNNKAIFSYMQKLSSNCKQSSFYERKCKGK